MKYRFYARAAARVERCGFTLLEIIVVLAILSVIAGAAVPVAGKILQAQMRKATRDELKLLGDAALEYFRDTNEVPHEISDLETDPKRADSRGWAGPYVTGAVKDPLTGKSNYEVDGWSRDYRGERGASFSITSLGADGVWNGASGETRGEAPDGGDDIAITVDFTPIRREKTLERLRIINQAVLLYNGQYQTTAPLPADYTTALAMIIERGLLPDAAEFRTDAWGVKFVAAPEGKAPLVHVKSKSM